MPHCHIVTVSEPGAAGFIKVKNRGNKHELIRNGTNMSRRQKT